MTEGERITFSGRWEDCDPTPDEEKRILGYLTALIRRGFIPLERSAFTFVICRHG